jgi:hypothetical protein
MSKQDRMRQQEGRGGREGSRREGVKSMVALDNACKEVLARLTVVAGKGVLELERKTLLEGRNILMHPEAGEISPARKRMRTSSFLTYLIVTQHLHQFVVQGWVVLLDLPKGDVPRNRWRHRGPHTLARRSELALVLHQGVHRHVGG